MNQENIQAPVALITGAGRRIGAAIATHLHSAGYRVIIHCLHSIAAAEELASKLNQVRSRSAMTIQADLSDPHVSSLITDSIHWAGRLDLLVNNASIFKRNEINIYNATDCLQTFNINVFAPLCLSQAAYPYLAETKGVIINITDIHAHKPLKQYSVYCQSKAALTMQTFSLAREFAPLVRVNAIAPGAIVWPEHSNSLTDEQQQQIIDQTPLRQHGDPCFIAQAVLTLATNQFITGEILRVDGGRSLS
ncbi:MAG: pteridine reductase [Legionella sp.]